jgi:hypothetical protein
LQTAFFLIVGIAVISFLAWRDIRQDANAAPVQASRPVVASVSSSELYSAYDANAVAADAKFKGNVAVVRGQISSIGKGLMNEPYIALASGRSLFSVQCFFSPGTEHTLANLQKGQEVSIQGTVHGKFGNVLVKDCRLIGH